MINALEEMDKRREAATKGPWEWWRDPGLKEDGVHCPNHLLVKKDAEGKIIDTTTICRGMTGDNRENNAQFIAHCPTDHERMSMALNEALNILEFAKVHFPEAGAALRRIKSILEGKG